MRFTALQDFFSDETQSHYCVGLEYTAPDGSKIAELVSQWVEQGKVSVGGSAAKVTGKG